MLYVRLMTVLLTQHQASIDMFGRLSQDFDRFHGLIGEGDANGLVAEEDANGLIGDADASGLIGEVEFHLATEEPDQLNDDELDNALEEELAASIQRHVHGQPGPPSPSEPYPPPASSSSLTFAFPGWGVHIYQDPKRCKPSIFRHQLETSAEQGQKPPIESEREGRKVSWGAADKPGNGHSVYRMPNEILLNVMKRLGVRDLCSAIQTCRWWQHLGSQDEVWERFDQNDNCKQAANSLPKWSTVKNGALSAQVQHRVACQFGYFRKGFDHLRSALCVWWETGRPDDQYNSKSISGLIHKMTLHDWTLVYEFFGVVFAERADCLAVTLMQEVEKESNKNPQNLCLFHCNHDSSIQGQEAKFSNRDFINILNKAPLDLECSPAEEDHAFQEGLVGRGIWENVDALWKRYKHWLMLVFEHCPELNREVMVEKARTAARSTTPTVYDKGVICFRSQVLLKYGLRRVLQSGFSWLSAQNASGMTSEFEVQLLRSIYHLLQEVDVLDDTFSPKSFTQAKLRRCFPIKRSYARHNMDERHTRSS